MLGDLSAYPVHDHDSCMELLDGDEELFAELIQLYSENTGQNIQSLEEAVEAGDRQAAAGCAHSIKGSSANLCIERLRHISSELERRAKEEPGLELSPFVAALKVEFNNFLQAVAVS